MGIEEVELEGLEYISKFCERLYITMACINDGRDISEEDYGVLFEVYRINSEGNLPFYKTICTDPVVTTTEPDLFTVNMSDTSQRHES